MNPTFSNITNDDGFLKFTLSDTNISFANAIRRIILSEIPCVVFRTTPHEKNLANIEINTSRLNNEIIKQRLSCIPIHIDDVQFPYWDHEIGIDVNNETDSTQLVTTENIEILYRKTQTKLSTDEVRAIFPPDSITGDYIIITRLRPRISNGVPGEHLKLTCGFEIGTAKENGSFNIVSTCGFAATPDEEAIKAKWSEIEKNLKERGASPDEIEYKQLDWNHLDAKRITRPDSFDFIIESVGIFTNENIVVKAGEVMLSKLDKFKEQLENGEIKIITSKTTMEHCFDVILENEDYTLGKVIENILYTKYYQTSINFCGFQKPHPHINKSILRVNFIQETDVEQLKLLLIETASIGNDVFAKISDYFKS